MVSQPPMDPMRDPEMLEAIAANSRVSLPIAPSPPPGVKITPRKTFARKVHAVVMMFLIRWSKEGFIRTVSSTTARVLAWHWGWGFQILDFLRHFATFRWYVEDAEYLDRMNACDGCPIVQVVESGPKAGKYCGACGCPKWSLSELKSKNRLRKHYCPAGFHGRGDTEKSETK